VAETVLATPGVKPRRRRRECRLSASAPRPVLPPRHL